MSRKRFIKLLMSQGASRNLARGIADIVIYQRRKNDKLNKIYAENGLSYRLPMFSYSLFYPATVSVIWQMCENEEDVVHELR